MSQTDVTHVGASTFSRLELSSVLSPTLRVTSKGRMNTFCQNMFELLVAAALNINSLLKQPANIGMLRHNISYIALAKGATPAPFLM